MELKLVESEEHTCLFERNFIGKIFGINKKCANKVLINLFHISWLIFRCGGLYGITPVNQTAYNKDFYHE